MVGIAVGRHVVVAVAVGASAVETFVDDVDDWNAVVRIAVVLGEDTRGDGAEELNLLRLEEPDWRDLVETRLDDRPSRLIPECLLIHGREAGVVAGLGARWDGLPRGRIDRKVGGVSHGASFNPPSAAGLPELPWRRSPPAAAARTAAGRRVRCRAAASFPLVAAALPARGRRIRVRRPAAPAASSAEAGYGRSAGSTACRRRRCTAAARAPPDSTARPGR